MCVSGECEAALIRHTGQAKGRGGRSEVCPQTDVVCWGLPAWRPRPVLVAGVLGTAERFPHREHLTGDVISRIQQVVVS